MKRYPFVLLLPVIVTALVAAPSGVAAQGNPDARRETRATARGNPVAEQLASLTREALEAVPDPSERRIAVLEFVISDEKLAKQGVGEALAVMLESHLDSLGVQLVERRHLSDIIEEMELAVSGLLDTDTAIRVGELAGADVIFTGSLSELGAMVNLNLRAVEAESGEVLFSSFTTLDRDLVLTEAEKYVVIVGGERSPFLAGIGSAVIPGLGQVYTDRPLKGAVIFGLATVGLVSAISAHAQAGDHHDEHEAMRQLYLSTVDPGEIARSRGEMQDAGESYRKATGSRDTLLLVTGILYGYGIYDAIRGAARHNRGLRDRFAFGFSTDRTSVRIQFTLGIR